MIRFELPFPPSMNHYWRRVGARTLISKQGREYRAAVEAIIRGLGHGTFDGPLGILIEAHPPDRRRRDLDNLLKAPLDAMQSAGLYVDDYQIDHIDLRRGGCVDGGKLSITIQPSQGPQQSDTSDLADELRKRAKDLQSELGATLEALAAVAE